MNRQNNFIEEEIIPNRVLHIQEDIGGHHRRFRIIDDFNQSHAQIVACVICDENKNMIEEITAIMTKLFMTEKVIENHGTFSYKHSFNQDPFKY